MRWWGEVLALKSGGDGDLQRSAVAAKSGGGGGESERDGGAFNHSASLVIVLTGN